MCMPVLTITLIPFYVCNLSKYLLPYLCDANGYHYLSHVGGGKGLFTCAQAVYPITTIPFS
jgi:hypothetical protein